jgi:hypothetical protein
MKSRNYAYLYLDLVLLSQPGDGAGFKIGAFNEAFKFGGAKQRRFHLLRWKPFYFRLKSPSIKYWLTS